MSAFQSSTPIEKMSARPSMGFPSAWGRTHKEAESWAAHEALLELEDEAPASEA